MRRFLFKRVLEVIPVIVGITTLAFSLIHLVPGDPARIELGPTASHAALARLREQLGLDHSLLSQYWHFMSGAFVGSFGNSLQYQQPVSNIIGSRVTASALLICYSLLVATFVALPLAMISALRRDRWLDHLIRLLTTTTFAMPSFWLGLMLSLIVGVHLGWLPTSGYGATWPSKIESLTLPSITIGLLVAAPLLRSLRSSLIDNLGAEYTEAVRVRGLSEVRVWMKHVLRNSVTSSITLLSLSFGVLLSGTVIVEQVFAIPGLGSLLVTSVEARDFPVVEALTFIFGLAVVVVSLLTDILYAVIDPRVRM